MRKSLKTLLLGAFFITGLFSLAPAAEERLTITTYYPSPYGSYNELYIAHQLGIGTTGPSATLDVAGFGRFTKIGDAPTSGSGTEIFYHETLDLGYLLAYDRTNLAYKPLRLEGSNIQLNSGSMGNVGIGTTAPGAKLHVLGGTIRITGAGSPTTGGALCLNASGNISKCTTAVSGSGDCTCL